jgi:hypothetical protein
LVIVPAFCAQKSGLANEIQFKFVIKQGSSEQLIPATLHKQPVMVPGQTPLGFAVLDVPGISNAPALRLSATPPRVGEPLSIILYRLDEPRVITSAADCKVTEVGPVMMGHQCDTGQGSAGAPLLNSADEVVGLHLMRSNPPETTSARALRADWIAARMNR